jgi:serine kinase of HPr protein (carbohydrate metabolism regulator)
VGKSDLALRLIDRGATLVSDDYTLIHRRGQRLIASPPPTIAGKIEVRNLGILEFDHVSEVPLSLYVDLDRSGERHPEPGESLLIAGLSVPLVAVSPLEASAPLKVELAQDRHGLKPQ